MTLAGTAVGLFAGIGGIELGLASAGVETELLCEIDPGATAVLRRHFPGVPHHGDITTLDSLPGSCDLVSGGFPCQDLSQAGRTAGIGGSRSGLVDHVFRLLDGAEPRPPSWLVLENVPFMLQLDRGEAMRLLTTELGKRGYRWAYRVVDARAFGVPQRRRRVLLVASKTNDPRPVLFGQEAAPLAPVSHDGKACGFYWTEGNTGLGWAVDAVPTIKGGSGFGIPSPPAIWMPDGSIVTPDIRDAERLQGLPPNWTAPAVDDAGLKKGARWKLVGNAVCVPMAEWLGTRLLDQEVQQSWGLEVQLVRPHKWPDAAWGEAEKVFEVALSDRPVSLPTPALEAFLAHEPAPLSERATRGFATRLANSSLRHPPEFMRDLQAHAEAMSTGLVHAG